MRLAIRLVPSQLKVKVADNVARLSMPIEEIDSVIRLVQSRE